MFLLLRLIVDVSPRMQRDGDRGMQQPNEVVRYFMIFFPPNLMRYSSKKRVS